MVISTILPEVEWNNAKAAYNIRKHGIDFDDAKNIFFDENRIEEEDAGDYGEIRIHVIGRAENEILLVVYTWREERYRLISARKASKDEKRIYYEGEAGS